MVHNEVEARVEVEVEVEVEKWEPTANFHTLDIRDILDLVQSQYTVEKEDQH
jgi:hypothetical protein